MATLVQISAPGQPSFFRLYVKGASEIILRKCERFALLPFSDSPGFATSRQTPAIGSRSNPAYPTLCPVDPKDGKPLKDYEGLIDDFAAESLRTIAIAYRDFTTDEFYALVRGPLRDKAVEARLLERSQREAKRSALHADVLRRDEAPPTPVVAVLETTGLRFSPPADVSSPASPPQAVTVSTTTPGSRHAPELLGVPARSAVRNVSFGSQSTVSTTSTTSSFPVETRSFESRSTDDDLAEMTDAEVLQSPTTRSGLEQALVFAGLVGIEDPLRVGVPEAVAQCQSAGVFVRMVTGDNVITAKSIALRCGIYTSGGVIMEGAYFRNMGPDEMAAKLPRLQVLARSSPTDKQMLVAKLRELGEIVAVTGDGTNDGPALKAADIGFSMGIAGTEVAKEASSIVLMDDSFSSVVKAIVWGRQVNDSIKKFLQFQLSVNLSAVVIAFVSSVADSSESSVLTAVQLLWVNLIMDTLAALALATEKPVPEILLSRPPESRRTPLITVGMWKMIVAQAVLQTAINLALVFAGPQIFQMSDLVDAGGLNGVSTSSSDVAQSQSATLKTVVFNTFVLLQVFNLINSRRLDKQLNVFDKIWENPPFLVIGLGICALQIIIVQFGGQAFSTVPLDGKYWGICLLIGLLSLPFGLVVRLLPNDMLSKSAQSEYSAHEDIFLDALPSQADEPLAVGGASPLHSPATSAPPALHVQLPATTVHHYLPSRPDGGSGSRSASPSPPQSAGVTSSIGGAATSAADLTAARARGQWEFAIRTVRTELSVFRALRASARPRSVGEASLAAASIASESSGGRAAAAATSTAAAATAAALRAQSPSLHPSQLAIASESARATTTRTG
ncbi:hypothetical protein HK405_009470 [Cladochytrium tenue]|nr:hypothetical protein HK405_009470 [Cladochytrium tenue]